VHLRARWTPIGLEDLNGVIRPGYKYWLLIIVELEGVDLKRSASVADARMGSAARRKLVAGLLCFGLV
jgi:hypothetical protein